MPANFQVSQTAPQQAMPQMGQPQQAPQGMPPQGAPQGAPQQGQGPSDEQVFAAIEQRMSSVSPQEQDIVKKAIATFPELPQVLQTIVGPPLVDFGGEQLGKYFTLMQQKLQQAQGAPQNSPQAAPQGMPQPENPAMGNPAQAGPAQATQSIPQGM